jgi:hypothetical protein
LQDEDAGCQNLIPENMPENLSKTLSNVVFCLHELTVFFTALKDEERMNTKTKNYNIFSGIEYDSV